MKRAISMAVAAVALGNAPAYGAISDQQFDQLKAEFAMLAQRISALEAENTRLRESSESTVSELAVTQSALAEVRESSSLGSWTETIKLKGDFRYRYEYIDVEDVATRERNRVRARAELTAKLPNDVDVGIGVASGSDDPVSANQTLGGGGTTKDFRLDLAYFKWQATEQLHVQAGKFKNPLYKPQGSGLLWDGDWRPEGISAGWQSGPLFVNFIGNWLESDTRKDNDAFAWGLQGGTRFGLGEASLTTSAAYYDFPTAGEKPFFDDEFFGNTSVDGIYRYDYRMIELAADLSVNLLDMPLSLFGHFVRNTDAGDFDTAWLLGAKIGKASGAGTWQFGYHYQDVEADAVFGLLSDSDFAGGGTDGKGHRLTGTYAINKQWNVGFTWLLNNETGEVNLADRGGALDYDRIMLDTGFKF